MPLYTPNPDHWANRGCTAWWANLPDQTAGTVWPDLFGQYPFTITYVSGTVNRNNGPWSPSGGSAAGILGSSDARPGAYTKGFLGPLYDGTAKWYATSSVPLLGTGGGSTSTLGGTLAFWHRPNVTNSTTYEVISVGTSTALLWDFQANTGGISAGFFANTELRAVALSAFAWDTTKWTHYAITWAPSDKCRLYVNGFLQATASSNVGTPVTCPSGTFYLGNSSWNGGTFASPSGYDDMSIWTRQMGAQEIWNVYNQSIQGWPGRINVWQPTDRFFYGLSSTPPTTINLGATSASAAAGGLTAELDVNLSAANASAFYGSMTGDWPISFNVSAAGSIGSQGSSTLELDALCSGQPASGTSGGLTGELDVLLTAKSASGANGSLTTELDVVLAGLGADGIPGAFSSSGGVSLTNFSVGSLTNPDHWANQDLAAWWGVTQGLAYGSQVYNLAGDPTKNFTLTNFSGTDSRPGGPWSQNIRPGALGNASCGPFTWGVGPTNYYGSSTCDINKLCPTAGTVSLWHCPTATADGVVLSQGVCVASPRFVFMRSSGALNVGFNSHVTSIGTGTLQLWNPGIWEHFVVTFAVNDLVRVYCNGVFVGASDTLPSTIGTVGTPYLTIGSGFNGSTFTSFAQSMVDDVNIWSRQMSAAEVARLYAESSSGWPNRLANWLPPQRFGFSPYYPGLSVLLAAPFATSSPAAKNVELDVSLASTTATATAGGTTEAIQPPLTALSASGAIGACSAELDVLLTGTLATTDTGGFYPPGTAVIRLAGLGIDAILGSETIELDILLSSLESDGAVGVLAAFWNSTFVYLSSPGSNSLAGGKSLEIDVALHGATASGGRGTFSIFLGALVVLVSPGATATPATDPTIDVSVQKTAAPGSSAKLGKLNAALSTPLSSTGSSTGVGSCSQTAVVVLRGPVATVIPGRVPFGPWIVLAAPGTAGTPGVDNETVSVRRAGQGALGRLGTTRPAIAVALPSQSANVATGSELSSSVVRLLASRANASLGARKIAVSLPFASAVIDAAMGTQTQKVVLPAQAVPVTASLAHWSFRLTVGLAASDATSTTGDAFGAPSPHLSAAGATARPGTEQTTPIAPLGATLLHLSGVGSAAKPGVDRTAASLSVAATGGSGATAAQSSTVAPILRAVSVTAKLGVAPRTIAVGLSGQSATATLGASLSSLSMVCTAGRVISSTGHGFPQSDPIAISLAAPGVTIGLGGLTKTLALIVSTAQTKASAGVAKPWTFVSLAGCGTTAARGQSSASVQIASPAARANAVLGSMLLSSPSISLDIVAPVAGAGLGGSVAAATMSVLAPDAGAMAGSVADTLSLVVPGVRGNALASRLVSAIAPYAYPDPFQAIEVEPVDPFEATDAPRN